MSDLIAEGSAWLRAVRHDYMSTVVTYRRGATTQADVPATRGRTPFRVDTGYGLFEHVEMRDYLIDVADLDVAFGTPKAGDQILDAVSGGTKVYEVSAPEGEPPFRYTDAAQATYRIHTKSGGIEVATTTLAATTTGAATTTLP